MKIVMRTKMMEMGGRGGDCDSDDWGKWQTNEGKRSIDHESTTNEYHIE